MKPKSASSVIIIIGLILFLISFLLPAYSVNSKIFYGYECAYIAPVLAISGDLEGGFAIQLLTRAHFLLLGLHNVILLICLLLSKKIMSVNYSWVLNLFVISTLNTILFFFYVHYSDQTMNEVLRIGYYVWIISSLLVLVPLIWQKLIK
ncbi:MAG: hypothetical protein ACFCU6_14415 [Balneolaceae bacterium]